jgi:hypothetical protein
MSIPTYSLRTDFSRILRVTDGALLRLGEEGLVLPTLCLDIQLDAEHQVRTDLLDTFTPVPALYSSQVVINALGSQWSLVKKLYPEVQGQGQLTTPGQMTGQLQVECFLAGLLQTEVQAEGKLTSIYQVGVDLQTSLNLQIQIRPFVMVQGGIQRCQP